MKLFLVVLVLSYSILLVNGHEEWVCSDDYCESEVHVMAPELFCPGGVCKIKIETNAAPRDCEPEPSVAQVIKEIGVEAACGGEHQEAEKFRDGWSYDFPVGMPIAEGEVLRVTMKETGEIVAGTTRELHGKWGDKWEHEFYMKIAAYESYGIPINEFKNVITREEAYYKEYYHQARQLIELTVFIICVVFIGALLVICFVARDECIHARELIKSINQPPRVQKPKLKRSHSCSV